MPARSAHYCGDHFFQDGESYDPYCDWLDGLVGAKITGKTKFTYVVYQTETCPKSEKDHVQFYFQTENAVEWKKCKKFFCDAEHGADHLEHCKGSADDNKKYCTKEESRKADGRANEIGEFREIAAQKGQGSREDLKKVKLAIDDGADWRQLLDLHFGTVARHDRFIKDYIELKRSDAMLQTLKDGLKNSTLKAWQVAVLESTQSVPDTRSVNWLWEAAGNAGKTWMSRYLAVMQDALILQSMKKADMIHLISKQLSKIVVFDLSRTSEDGAVNVVYEVAELLKNGYICSGKYDSRSLAFAPPHVFVFANFAPDRSKLSADRWNVKNIIDEFPEENSDGGGAIAAVHDAS